MTKRANLPQKVVSLLTAPANVAIHGLPGSGKSWMMDAVIALLSSGDTKIVRVDLSTTRNGAEVFEDMVRVLTGDTVEPSSDGRIRDVNRSWRAARGNITDHRQHVVLVLDQFDRVLNFPDAQDFLLLFRELVHRPESVGCTTLLASRRSLQTIETLVRGISTLANVCYTEYLGAIGADDLASIMPRANDLSTMERRACLAWSGGHLALVKYWLVTRPDSSPDNSAEIQRMRVALQVLDHLEDVNLTNAAAQLVLGPVVDSWALEQQELELLGILDEPGQEDAGGLCEQEVFRDALSSRTWNMNPWGILGICEVRVRGLIEAILSTNYGDDWAAVVCKRSGGVRAAQVDALKKLEREHRLFKRHAPWLSYTYPADLWTIVSSEWDLFRPIFDSHDKAHWRAVFTGLARYRSPLAHGRSEVLGAEERAQCRIYAAEVIDCVRVHQAAATRSGD